jgi:transposase
MPLAEVEFIALWNAGLEIAAIAQRLGIPKGTVQSRAHRLQQRGLIQPRPKGRVYPSQRAKVRQDSTSLVQSSADTPSLSLEEARAERWNLWLPRGLRHHIEAVAKARGHGPSKVVQEALW